VPTSRLVTKLQSLSDTLTHLEIGHAKDVAEAFNRRLSGLLGADLIIARLYWREPTLGRGNLLKPITYTKGDKFESEHDPEQFLLPSSEPDGILSLAFRREESFWV